MFKLVSTLGLAGVAFGQSTYGPAGCMPQVTRIDGGTAYADATLWKEINANGNGPSIDRLPDANTFFYIGDHSFQSQTATSPVVILTTVVSAGDFVVEDGGRFEVDAGGVIELGGVCPGGTPAPTSGGGAPPTPPPTPSAITPGCATGTVLPSGVVGTVDNCADQTDIVNQGITDPVQPDPLSTSTIPSVVVNIEIKDANGNPVPINNLPDPITFNIPLKPNTVKEVETRFLDSADLKCTKTELRCEFWDVEKKVWSSAGCTTEYIPGSLDAKCSCNHLTAFALVLRQEHQTDPTCAAGGHSFAVAGLYFIVMVTAVAQLTRTGVSEVPCAKDLVRLQHISIIVICVLRIIVLIMSNAFAASPGVIVLFAQVATLFMLVVFAFQALQWGKLGFFAMNKEGAAKLETSSKVFMGILGVVAMLFPILILTASDRTGMADMAKIGSIVMGGFVCIFSVLVLVFGCSLVKQLKGLRRTTGKAGASSNNRYNDLESRLATSCSIFAGCFFLQGVTYILSVQSNALAEESLDILFPLVFHVLDCLALVALLYLLSRVVAVRAEKYRAKRSGSESAGGSDRKGTGLSGDLEMQST